MGKIFPFNLDSIAEQYLAVPIAECEKSKREFGVIIKKPNYFQRPFPQLNEKLKLLSYDKHYVFSEMLLALNPKSTTTMMSHEGELYEIVQVLGPAPLNYVAHYFRVDPKIIMNFPEEKHNSRETFFAIDSNHLDGNNLPEGFYHQLKNPSKSEFSLAHILLIAGKRWAIKDGQLMKYGINRPPNSYPGMKK